MSAQIITNAALQSLRFTKRYTVAKKGLSFVYPSDLFAVRSDIRRYSVAPADVTKQAERIAIDTMLKGISKGQALNNAKAFLWNYANRWHEPGSVA
jgi:glucose dehydrogenase